MNKIIISLVLVVFFLASASLAQPMMGHGKDRMPPKMEQDRPCCGMAMKDKDMKGQPEIPDLTDEQKAQLENLQIEHMKSVQPLHNQLAERQAELHTLSTAAEVNMSKINGLIEEIGKLRTEMMKEHVKHRQAVRKILNEKQRLIFDNKPMHRCMMEE